MSEKSNIWELDVNNIYKDYRRMSTEQLENKYIGVSISTIKNMLKKYNFEVSKKNINLNLSKEEIIFMYESLLTGEIKSLSSGILSCDNKTKYLKIIFRYLVEDILKWNKQDLINKYSGKVLDKYFLKGAISTVKIPTYELLNSSFPQYNIKSWELKSSNVGNGFWNDNNINDSIIWLKNKLLKDKNLDNINQCARYGFDKILEEYNLVGMRCQKFDSTIEVYEKMYNCTYDKQEMLKENYTFNINPILNIETKLNNNIYVIQNKYYELDDIKKTLCNEIIRFCEENNKYPEMHDMSNKNGYISQSQFTRYMNGFINVYKFISPVSNTKGGGSKVNDTLIKPKIQICECCGKEKLFTEEYFNSRTNSKFGLSYICKVCGNEMSTIKRYNKLGIKIERIGDLSVGQWWEYLYKGKLYSLPSQFYKNENYPQLLNYIINDYLNIITKEHIIEWFKTPNLKKYKINDIVFKMGGKIKALQLSFPEMNFVEKDFEMYTKESVFALVDDFITINNLTIEDILKGKTNLREDKKMTAMMSRLNNKDIGLNDLLVWYLKEKNMTHPISKQNISIYDFNKSSNFFKDKDNRINNIKHYCENICKENVLNSINDTDSLKQWIFKYFKQSNIANVFPCYHRYYKGLYNLLIDCYPQIKENNILFEWEWTQCGKNNIEFLINMLREYVLYRMNDVVVDIIKDAPNYINIAYFNVMFSKMNKHIAKHRFKNYYEWLCLAFPEYKDEWKKEDFKIIVAKDGNELDSFEERDVYEYIQSEYIFKFVKPIGKTRSGKYTFKLDETYEYEKFCPDFVIEYIYKDNKKIKLSKPIIIEYYGMYEELNKNKIFTKYREKTLVKEKYYKSNKDIYYIGIYPKDIKNNYEGLAKKLGSFYMENLLNILQIVDKAI